MFMYMTALYVLALVLQKCNVQKCTETYVQLKAALKDIPLFFRSINRGVEEKKTGTHWISSLLWFEEKEMLKQIQKNEQQRKNRQNFLIKTGYKMCQSRESAKASKVAFH